MLEFFTTACKKVTSWIGKKAKAILQKYIIAYARRLILILVLSSMVLHYFYDGDWPSIIRDVSFGVLIFLRIFMTIIRFVISPVYESVHEILRKESIFCPSNDGNITRFLGNNSAHYNDLPFQNK